jgi:hypothetical protein
MSNTIKRININGNQTPLSITIFEFSGPTKHPISNYPAVQMAYAPSKSGAVYDWYIKNQSPSLSKITHFETGKTYAVLSNAPFAIEVDRATASVVLPNIKLQNTFSGGTYHFLEYTLNSAANITDYPNIQAVWRVSPNSSTRSVMQTWMKTTASRSIPQAFNTLEPGQAYLIRISGDVTINNTGFITPTSTPSPTLRPAPTPTPTLPAIVTSVTRVNDFVLINNEPVTNALAAAEAEAEGVSANVQKVLRPATIGNFLPAWGTINRAVRIVYSDGRDYTFIYTFGGKDFIARRDNVSRSWTLVGYMYDGGKAGENMAFSNSDNVVMRWGTDPSNSTQWSNLLHGDSIYTNSANIVKFGGGMPSPAAIKTFQGFDVVDFTAGSSAASASLQVRAL